MLVSVCWSSSWVWAHCHIYLAVDQCHIICMVENSLHVFECGGAQRTTLIDIVSDIRYPQMRFWHERERMSCFPYGMGNGLCLQNVIYDTIRLITANITQYTHQRSYLAVALVFENASSPTDPLQTCRGDSYKRLSDTWSCSQPSSAPMSAGQN